MIKTEDTPKIKTEEPKKSRRIIRKADESIVIDYEIQAGLDSTADIVKNPRFYYPVTDLIP